MDTKDLEAKIDELIHLIDELEQKQGSLSADKTKVEAMIQRLKTLDPDQ